MAITAEPQRPPGWVAELELAYAARGGATILEHRRHRGPLQVQRPFYPEGPGCCHTYVLHPPGGLVGGDSLHLRIAVKDGAAALLTTPSASKAYRSREESRARVTQALTAAPGAFLEWLPQETIVFDGAHVELETRVDLAADASFIGWEMLCLGRPAAGEAFTRGECRQRLELWRAGAPIVLERTLVRAGAELQSAAWGLAGQPVLATLIASPVAEIVDDLRSLSEGLPPGDQAAVTVVDGALVCRYLGGSAERARTHFVRAWTLLRPAVVGRAPCPPRIWMT